MIDFQLFLAFLCAAWGRGMGIESPDDMAVAIVVQHEAGGLSSDLRASIAEIIYNRVQSGDFPDTVYEVLFAPNQFTGIEDWITAPEWLPTKETIEAVKRARDERIHNCTYYYNPDCSTQTACWWFEHSGDVTYMFSIVETSWGVKYETRFFI